MRTEGERVETCSTADYLAHALSVEKAGDKATGRAHLRGIHFAK
jgi:hypothetical protein